MKEMRKSWFSNPRGLPLDKNGRVDFSLDQEKALESGTPSVDHVHGERFMGRLFDAICMPDGGRIIKVFRWDDSDPELPLHIINHNVFRLDHENNIVWQVRRNEDDFVNWDSRNQHAREENPDCAGYADPFQNMSKQFFVRRPLPDKGPFHPKYEEIYFDTYAPGRLLWLTTRWWAYDLDPDTGMATCTGEQVR